LILYAEKPMELCRDQLLTESAIELEGQLY
jgi:hypothetical protein